MTTLSPELKAMAEIEGALKDLPEDERSRVMQWAAARFGGVAVARAQSGSKVPAAPSSGDNEYNTLAELYDAASPTTDAERALVISYWFQCLQGATDVESQAINKELKHLGHGVGNITRAFSALKSHKPALVIQTRKEGTTQQARKRYKVTGEGKKAVEKLLAGGGE